MIGSFLKKVGLFLVLVVFLIESLAFLLLKTDLFLIDYSGSEIYHALNKSHKVNEAKTLLIGDSVANQLFPNSKKDGSINSLACNQAISMAGHYVLVKNYLEAGNKIDTLIGLFTPFSLKTNLDQVYTFHCFIKPFYIDRYKENFSKEVISQVRKIPYHQFAHVPHIKATTWAPKYEVIDTVPYTFLSPISIEYLSKLKQLADDHGIKFMIVPTPVSNASKMDIEMMKQDEVNQAGLSDLFVDFFKQITFLDSSFFYDGTHLKKPYIYTAKYVQYHFDPTLFKQAR